jgi:hypothetical protein
MRHRVPGLFTSEFFASRNFFLTWEGIAIASLAIAAVGAGTTAYSSVAAGENAKETQDFNAEMQRRGALDAEQRGALEAADKRQQTRQLIARQHAAQAANGFNTSTGTPLDIMSETAGMGELDALRIQNNAARQASGLRANANLDVSKGNAALSAGQFGAAGTILTTTSNAGMAIAGFGQKAGWSAT